MPRQAKSSLSKGEQEWRAQDDLRILKTAEEIRKDKSRMSAANNEAKKQIEALSKTMDSTGQRKPRAKAKQAPRAKARTTRRKA